MPIVVYRLLVLGVTSLAVATPLSLVVYQSFLTAPFFDPSAQLGLLAYSFVFADPDFWQALWTTVAIACGMAAIAVPLGALLAFLMVRTDVPGRHYLESLILIPIFVSAVVIAFGYVVAIGPVGIFSTLAKDTLGFVPWNLYSLLALIVIAGLTHVPHVYLYSAAALRGLGKKVVLILGGEGKGQDFTPLREPVKQFAAHVLLIGRDAPLIAKAVGGEFCASLEEAVNKAAKVSAQAVLLSPACASFDMFRDYKHRGEVFAAAVRSLPA